MASPLDRIPPKLRRAPYEVDVEHPLETGREFAITIVLVGPRASVGPVEVALVCRSAEDGELLAEVATTVDGDGGTVNLTVPEDGPPTADGDEIVNAWTVRVRATDARRRDLALPTPVWVGVPE